MKLTSEAAAMYRFRVEATDGGFRITLEGPSLAMEPPPECDIKGIEAALLVENIAEHIANW